jgi:hypothetical protein
MIKLYDQIPQVYNNASRDFQYLSHLYDIVLNYVKHNIDDMYSLPTCLDNTKLAELLSLTLGFKIRRNYDQKQLAALVSILPNILKCKGTITAVDLAANAILKAANTQGTYLSRVENNVLHVILPEDTVDTNLFLDILPYILPAGISVNIIKRTVILSTLETEAGYESTLKAAVFKDYQFASLHGSSIPGALWKSETYLGDTDENSIIDTGIGFSTGIYPPDYHYVLGTDTPYLPNSGLLENDIIPVLGNAFLHDESTPAQTTSVVEPVAIDNVKFIPYDLTDDPENGEDF